DDVKRISRRTCTRRLVVLGAEGIAHDTEAVRPVRQLDNDRSSKRVDVAPGHRWWKLLGCDRNAGERRCEKRGSDETRSTQVPEETIVRALQCCHGVLRAESPKSGPRLRTLWSNC